MEYEEHEWCSGNGCGGCDETGEIEAGSESTWGLDYDESEDDQADD